MRRTTRLLWVLAAMVGIGCSSQSPTGGQAGGPGGRGGATTGSRGGADAASSEGGAAGGNVTPGGTGGGLGVGGANGGGSGGASHFGGTGGAAGIGMGGEAQAGSGGAPLHGSSDAAVDANAGRDANGPGGCAGLFCEDFEKGSIDPAIWDVKVGGGKQPAPALVSQAGLVAHGKFAAHFHVDPPTKAKPYSMSDGFIIVKNPPAALKGHHYGRAYFMITPMPPTEHTEYIFAGSTGFPQLKYLEVASAAPLAWQVTYVDLVPPGTGENYHSGGKVPVGKWFCLEWEFNDAPDQAAIYVNGVPDFAQETFTFDGATSGLVGGFEAFGFGYYAWHPATYAFDVYYDDIVLDTKRVGCLD